MIFSIYHFFADLIAKRQAFFTAAELADFPFDKTLLSCKADGVFPDMAIRLSGGGPPFTGGELVELKDSTSGYRIAPFNSTIPCGRKNIADFISGENSVIRTQMEQSGEDVDSLPVRDVFYLVRGRRKDNIKICLVHGYFFETITVANLIRNSIGQALEQAASEKKLTLSQEEKEKFLDILTKQQHFSKTRNVEKSSVSLRFRIMTHAKAEGNILNKNKYPQIGDNTLNLAIPFHDDAELNSIHDAVRQSPLAEVKELQVVFIKHYFNGPFVVFQISL
jgi:hypothetical protein